MDTVPLENTFLRFAMGAKRRWTKRDGADRDDCARQIVPGGRWLDIERAGREDYDWKATNWAVRCVGIGKSDRFVADGKAARKAGISPLESASVTLSRLAT